MEEGLFGPWVEAEFEHAISMWTDLPMTDSEGDVDSVKNTSSWSRSCNENKGGLIKLGSL